jgi:hypothetical protein
MEQQVRSSQEVITECLNERMQIKEYVHERKESLLAT